VTMSFLKKTWAVILFAIPLLALAENKPDDNKRTEADFQNWITRHSLAAQIHDGSFTNLFTPAFLGPAKERLDGAHPARKSEVAFVAPRFWASAANHGIVAFEDARWTYLALQHNHIPVDVLSERQLIEDKLQAYKAVYICGPGLRRDAAAKVKEWVRNGGILWTDALGLSRDETNKPLDEMNEVFGVTNRTLESWANVEPSSGKEDLKPFLETNAPPKKAKTVDMGEIEFEVAVGREPLETKTGKVLARFGDNKAAVVQNNFGKGKVFLYGFWAGLSYSAAIRKPDVHWRDDLDPALASAITRAAHAAEPTIMVQPSERLVEAVFLNKPGKRSILLKNWDYEQKASQRKGGRIVPTESVSLNFKHVGTLHSVRSLVHGDLKIEQTPGAESPNEKTVILPKIDTIDLLILE
jgi:hypothetical protein